jgi:hypothetical protein
MLDKPTDNAIGSTNGEPGDGDYDRTSNAAPIATIDRHRL